MVGQERLLKQLKRLIQKNKFPRFSIFCGQEGSGKKKVFQYIVEQFNDNQNSTEEVIATIYGKTVEDVRQLIADSNKLAGTKHICLIPDADTMSVQAKNALLKLTEEPPANAYIVMTLVDTNNTLDTIRSRATTFLMQPYLPSQLMEYMQLKEYEEKSINVCDACETPGEIDLLYEYDVDEFYEFVKKTVDNIATVNGANVFKLTDKIKLKEEGAGYDLKLFLKLFIKVCYDRFVETDEDHYMKGVLITSNYLKDLRIKGISKSGVIDLWILDIRKEWM